MNIAMARWLLDGGWRSMMRRRTRSSAITGAGATT